MYFVFVFYSFQGVSPTQYTMLAIKGIIIRLGVTSRHVTQSVREEFSGCKLLKFGLPGFRRLLDALDERLDKLYCHRALDARQIQFAVRRECNDNRTFLPFVAELTKNNRPRLRHVANSRATNDVPSYNAFKRCGVQIGKGLQNHGYAMHISTRTLIGESDRNVVLVG